MSERRKMATTRELSAWLDIPEETLRWWRAHGQGPPYVRLGRHVRYPMPEVDRWVAGRLLAAS
jgi:hypothetical protein